MTTSSGARIAVLTSWANTGDRTARTQPARDGLQARFEREARERLGKDATDKQVADAAAAYRRVHFTRMAQKRWAKKAKAADAA